MAYGGTKSRYLVDLHVHGADKYDTRTRRQDDILRIAEVHGNRGTNAVLPAIYPSPVEEMRDHLGAVQRAMTQQRGGAKILGVHLEGPFLHPDWAGALDRKNFQDPSVETLNRILDGFEDVVKVMTIAPELPGSLRVIEACREKGILVQMGHSDASFEQAEEGKRAGATGITHIFNAMRGFHHREPGLAGFGLMDDDVYVEVIADLSHLHPQSLKMIMDMKSPDKILLISDSVAGPGWGKGAIRGPGGVLQGSGIALAEGVKNIVSLGVPPETAQLFAGENPLRYLGLDRAE